jgi:hypothetical protein
MIDNANAARQTDCRRQSGNVETVLYRDWHAMQRTQRLCGSNGPIGSFRFAASFIEPGNDDSIDQRIDLLDPRSISVENLDAAEFLTSDSARKFGSAQQQQWIFWRRDGA